MEKKLPLRMCIVCKQMKPKSVLVRIVKIADSDYKLDITGRQNGRGAYICNNDECFGKLMRTKALSKAFKTNVSKEIYETILGDYAANKN